MTRIRTAALLGLLLGSLLPAAARAQLSLSDAERLEPVERYRSPQRFAFEARWGPYLPNIDDEFNGARTPYRDFFGDGQRVFSQIEFSYEFFHRLGTAAIGIGVGNFSATGNALIGTGSGVLTTDESTLRIVPMSVSAIYRFDYFLETRGFPLVPFGKAGLDYAYWQITDGNDEIARDTQGGTGRGGTPGWHVAAGLALVLDFFDRDAARSFDRDLGVNHTSLVFQMTHADISGLGLEDRLHVGDTNWSLGLMFQF